MRFTQITVELLIINTNKQMYGNFTCKINTFEPEINPGIFLIENPMSFVIHRLINDKDDFGLYA